MRQLTLATCALLTLGTALAQANDSSFARLNVVIDAVMQDLTVTQTPCSAALRQRAIYYCYEYPYSEGVFVDHEMRGAQSLFLARMSGTNAATEWVHVNGGKGVDFWWEGYVFRVMLLGSHVFVQFR